MEKGDKVKTNIKKKKGVSIKISQEIVSEIRDGWLLYLMWRQIRDKKIALATSPINAEISDSLKLGKTRKRARKTSNITKAMITAFLTKSLQSKNYYLRKNWPLKP
jgi:hypothetical protein